MPTDPRNDIDPKPGEDEPIAPLDEDRDDSVEIDMIARGRDEVGVVDHTLDPVALGAIPGVEPRDPDNPDVAGAAIEQLDEDLDPDHPRDLVDVMGQPGGDVTSESDAADRAAAVAAARADAIQDAEAAAEDGSPISDEAAEAAASGDPEDIAAVVDEDELLPAHADEPDPATLEPDAPPSR